MKTKSLLLASALLMSASTFAQKNIFKGVVLDDQGGLSECRGEAIC